jgi:hypothetical protein
MSPYLRNLIARHSATAAPGGIVLPRIRSRFEADPAPAPAALPPETGPAPVAARPEATPARRRGDVSSPPASADSLERQHTRSSRSPRPPSGDAETAPEAQTGKRRKPAGQNLPPGTGTRPQEEAPHLPDRRAGKALPVPEGLSPRIQDTARRPGNGLRPRSGRSAPPTPGREVVAPRPDAPTPGAPDGLTLGVELTTNTEHSPPAREDETGQPALQPRRPGPLRTPGWVAEIQSALQERHGPGRPSAEPEPTVNVTIGRIDIRAVRRETRDRSGPGPEPGRIMSLDDYLDKRNGRPR